MSKFAIRAAKSMLSSPRLWSALLASTALTIPHARAAEALPSGGQVVAGSASIGTVGKTTTITQSSSKAIVNWSDFSIGQGYTVNFVQPNSASATLNRVTGTTSSTIAGTLRANGQVYLINPNGIAITSTGTVKAGSGFVASTLDITNQDFLNGKLNFLGAASSAPVVNQGIITIGRGGYAALIGGQIRNDGLIAVPLGRIGLGAGEQATLDLSGDGFLQVAVGNSAQGGFIGNTGTIAADGGTVVMTAAVARNAARNSINLGGVVEASTVEGRNGAIVISGGDGGTVEVSGIVKATAASGTGGAISVTGDSIALTGATIDASGAQGGGSVRIGGDQRGQGTLQHAATTSVDQATVIRADATSGGQGGQVVVWSDEKTDFAGLITARGAGTGRGGDAEVSGKTLLNYAGVTDLTGPGGFGTLLLDPYDITITAADGAGTSTTATGNDSTLAVSTLQTALSTANVTVTTGAAGSAGSQAGNITVADAVTWGSGSTLTLSAYDNIAVNANLTGGTGSSISLRADNSGTGTGTVTFGSGVTATASGGVSLYYDTLASGGYAANAGSGTTLTAYSLVNSLTDLQNMGLTGNYALGKDIDASATATGVSFSPIGGGTDLNNPTMFTGIFDGLGHTISGLTINQSDQTRAGLFGYVDVVGIVRNVGLVGGSVTGGVVEVGSLVAENWGTISNAYATGTVTGSSYHDVGGLVGFNKGTITNAYATGDVTGASSRSVGGLVGTNDGTISNAYAAGAVTGNNSALMIGGLVGQNWGTISNAYATGAVTGNSGANFVGGLVGDNERTISNTYAVGAVTGNVSSQGGIGGLVGANMRIISGSYWDTVTTGQSNGIGMTRGPTDTSGVTGLTTSQFQDTANFLRISSSSFDSAHVWAPPSAGYYPVLYALSPVVWLQSVTTTSTYGDSTAVMGTITGGGTQSYVFGTAGDSLPLTNTTISTDPTQSAGTHSTPLTTSNTTQTSANGTAYRVFSYGNNVVTVEQATLTVTASGTMVYGDTTPTATYSTSGWKNGQGDSLLSGVSVATNATSTSNVGTYTATASGGTLSGAAIGNYNITYGAAGFTVTPRALTITGDALSRVYGDANPALTYSLTSGTLVNNNTLANTVSGALATAATTASAVGSYATTQGTLAASPNYTLAYLPGSVTVTPRALTITGDALSRVYGDANPALTYSLTSGTLVNGDTLTGALATAATTASAVGSYATTQGTLAAGTNYALGYTSGTLTVTPRALTITGDALSRVYGDANPTLSYSLTSGTLVNGDTLTGALATAATTASAVGSYATTQGTLAASPNYTLAYLPGSVTVTPRALTITGDALSRVYGDANPTLSYSLTSGTLVNGDTLTGALATAATTASAVGSYATTQGTLAAGTNYALGYTSGTLTVTPRALTITGDALSRVYMAMPTRR